MPKLLPVAALLALLTGPVLAQGTAISPGQSLGNAPAASTLAPPAATTAPAPKAERTAKSKDCSMQADQQGLHGKERKKFRSKCKSGKV